MKRALLPPALLLLAALLTACASTPLATAESVSFDPDLGIDLDSMERMSNGLYYRDVTEGDGDEARSGRSVSVYYVVWLSDGTPIDGLAPPNEPVEFRLGEREVIRGWDQGIVGMRVGGQRVLVVPPALAYGRGGTENVPPNSVLVFVVELVGLR